MTAQRVLPGPEGSRFSAIIHVTETGSTNADLLTEAAAGRAEGAVLVADHQAAGRGRQARSWHDERGNAVLMSVLLRPPPELVSVLPLLAGLAVSEAVDRLSASSATTRSGSPSPSPVALKWPNDVLVPDLGERKLAGILAEATTAGAGGAGLAIVVGIGLNLRWNDAPPAEVAARAATLEEHLGRVVDRWAVVEAILVALERWLRAAERGGPPAVLGPYRRRCLTLGRRVRLERPADVVEGTATAIAPDGALVVETGAGPVAVTAGDAHHV